MMKAVNANAATAPTANAIVQKSHTSWAGPFHAGFTRLDETMDGGIHSRPLILPLTGLRFLAAFAIVLHHVQGHFGVPNNAFQDWKLEQGVTIFFVLSGFVLAYSYPALDKPGDTRHFYVGRIARILPAHLLTLLAAVALGMPFEVRHFFVNATLLQSWVPTGDYFFSYNAVSWSISTEMAFYLIFPLLISKFASTWTWKLAGCLVASMGVAVLAWQLALPFFNGGKNVVIQGLVMVNPIARIFEFCLGMAAALLRGRCRESLIHLRFGTWAAVELIGVVLLVWGVHWINVKLYPLMVSSAMQYWTGQSLIPAVPAALLLIILASSTGPLARVLACPPVRFLGEISFAIYLTHQLILRFFSVYPQVLRGLSQYSAIGVYFVVVLATSTALHLVENPARRMIVRTFGRSSNRNAASAGEESLVTQRQG